MRFASKYGYLVAVICLALMVIALGAAAKHSQFESPADSTHYLKQSVKMVASNDHPAVVAPIDSTPTFVPNVIAIPIAVVHLVVLTSSPAVSPLLI